MRLFIATTFPAEAMRDLNDRVARLRPRLPPAAWVRTESQHVTFAFLGEQNDDVPDRITGPLEAALAHLRPFEASLNGCGFFPGLRRARVGWIGLDPEEPFVELAGAIRAAVAGAGLAVEGSDFRAHLTLMRLRDGWPPGSTALFLNALRDFRSPAVEVRSVTLYQSRLDPRGAVHLPVRAFRIGQ